MVGDIIKELRVKLNYTQAELGEMVDLSASTIGMYEQNRRTPDIETIESIATALNCAPEYLLGWTKDPINYDDPDVTAEIPIAILHNFEGDPAQAYKAHQAILADARKENDLESIGVKVLEDVEKQLIYNYRNLNDIGKNKVDNYIKDLSGNPIYCMETERNIPYNAAAFGSGDLSGELTPQENIEAIKAVRNIKKKKAESGN